MATRKAGQGSGWCGRAFRFAIYTNWEFKCAYCGRSTHEHGVGLSLDHIVACELGGENDAFNLVCCCISCNSRKQDKSMVEWYRVLKAEGYNIRSISARISRIRRKPLDLAEGRRLAQVDKVSRQAKAA